MKITAEQILDLAKGANDLALDSNITYPEAMVNALLVRALSDVDPGAVRRVLLDYKLKTKY